MRSAKALGLGILLGLGAPGLRAQAKPPAQTPAKAATVAKAASQTPKTAPSKPAAQTATKPAASNPPAKAAAKPAAKTSKPVAKSSLPKASKAAKRPAAAGAAESETKVARRDPFESLIGRQKNATEVKNLPPGKAGLQVSTLRLDGIVRAPNGMIAVVTNPQSRTYFLRDGDQLYDGRVEKITMDGVSFHEMGKDAFGKPVEREVTKRIYSSPGEQQ